MRYFCPHFSVWVWKKRENVYKTDKNKREGKSLLEKGFDNKLHVTCPTLACTDGSNWESPGSSECCTAEDEGLTCFPVIAWAARAAAACSAPDERPALQRVSAVDLFLIQLCQKGGHYSRAKRTGARQTKGSSPQGADESILLSKFTISSCALMLWDKAVTLQYKTTWKHLTTVLSFPYWNSAAANNTGTGTTWLLFPLLWAYTNQMPNQPMYKIALNVPSRTEAIVNKIQNVQQCFLQLAFLVRGKDGGIKATRTYHTGTYYSRLSQ